jgi:hypothetical protein
MAHGTLAGLYGAVPTLTLLSRLARQAVTRQHMLPMPCVAHRLLTGLAGPIELTIN